MNKICHYCKITYLYLTLILRDFVSELIREMPSDSKLSEAVIDLLKSLSTDFAHFEKFSDAILAKVRAMGINLLED